MIVVDVGGDGSNVRREIVDKAVEIIPRFIDIAKSLGLDVDDVN